jgi:hypothetical protein
VHRRLGRGGGRTRCDRRWRALRGEGLEDLGVRVALHDDLTDGALVEGAGEGVIDEHERAGHLADQLHHGPATGRHERRL